MKKWYLLFLTGFLLWKTVPSTASDVGKLLPVELLYIDKEGETVVIQTDNELEGHGRTWEEAYRNLEGSASGEVFLDTANTLLVTERTEELIPALLEVLRPSCGVGRFSGGGDLKQTASYLRAHRVQTTILEYVNGETDLQQLIYKEGRLHLNGGIKENGQSAGSGEYGGASGDDGNRNIMAGCFDFERSECRDLGDIRTDCA